jgi:hypothetical protein
MHTDVLHKRNAAQQLKQTYNNHTNKYEYFNNSKEKMESGRNKSITPTTPTTHLNSLHAMN